MSMFMPVNLPITAGMLLSSTVPRQLFWQWMNQSYNAGFNFANRNASAPADARALALSYGVATGTAVGMSLALGRAVDALAARVGGAPGAPRPLGLRVALRALPWAAVASAGVANVVAMRYADARDGVALFGPDGAPAGTSVAAGRACLAQVALTRAVLPVPILLVPPFVLDALAASAALGPLMARSAGARIGVELAVLSVFLQCALPPAVALFPQTGTIAASDLEPAFRGRFTAAGAPITAYTYNKGI